ncbi:MAG: FHA domain-containing protein [Labilithrix sp.]|nr:FHA domain-containing protein [Labilithrix sp.]
MTSLLVQQFGGAREDETRRILIGDGLVLGRDNPLFAERYPKLSRRHAELTIEDRHVRVNDLGSRHGTFVQGRRVDDALVSPGRLLEAGGVGFIVVRAPALFVPASEPRLAFSSHDFAEALRGARAARQSRRALVIVGEHGVGKSALADELLADEPTATTWDMSLAPPHPTSTNATIVDRLDEATEETQRELLASLRSSERDPNAPRVIVLSCEAPEALARAGRLIPALLSYLDTWVIRVSPLRARPEDVLPIVRARLEALAPSEGWDVHPKVASRLVTSPWPGNVRALLAEVERLYLSATDRQLVDTTETSSSVAKSDVCKVGADASWIEDASGARVELGARRVLRAVLLALIEAHARGGELLTPNDIARITWPGERMLPRAASNRVYVAVTSLRKLGFGRTIEHVNTGYRFAEGAVEIVS